LGKATVRVKLKVPMVVGRTTAESQTLAGCDDTADAEQENQMTLLAF
jgi:phosphohistidine swiveling domain-containing protein